MTPTRPPAGGPWVDLAFVGFLLLVGLTATVFVGAESAALVFGGHHTFDVGPGEALTSALGLLLHPGNPTGAWPVVMIFGLTAWAQ